MCGEVSAQVKKSQHRFVIGPRGKHLGAIQQQTGVVLEVPATDSPSETIILRGEQPALVHALTMMYEFANSMVADTCEIAPWLHKYIIGKGGANLKKIAADMPKIHIQFAQDSGLVSIEGPTQEVAIVKSSLLLQAQELAGKIAEAVVKVKPEHHRNIIGRGGATINKIKKDTGANINIPADGSGSDEIRIDGEKEAVGAAVKIVKEIAAKLARLRTVDLIIPHNMHSEIIGKSGAKIKEIISRFHGMAINFPDRKEDSDIVTLRGDKEDVEAAETFFKKHLKELELENYELDVIVYRQFHKNVIGKGGATVGAIMKETGTRVEIPDAKSDSDVITVVGREANCQRARDMILKIQSEFADIVDEVITIDPKYHGGIIGPNGRVIASIMTEFGVQVRFPRVAGKATKKPEDTAPDAVTVSGPSEDVAKAKVRLLELASERALNSHNEDLTVPRKYHRFLIGKAGAILKDIIKETGIVSILFPNSKSGRGDRRGGAKKGEAEESAAIEVPEDLVTIVGRKEACLAARALVEKRVHDLENVVSEKTQVDPKYFKFLTERRFQFVHDLSDTCVACGPSEARRQDAAALVIMSSA